MRKSAAVKQVRQVAAEWERYPKVCKLGKNDEASLQASMHLNKCVIALYNVRVKKLPSENECPESRIE